MQGGGQGPVRLRKRVAYVVQALALPGTDHSRGDVSLRRFALPLRAPRRSGRLRGDEAWCQAGLPRQRPLVCVVRRWSSSLARSRALKPPSGLRVRRRPRGVRCSPRLVCALATGVWNVPSGRHVSRSLVRHGGRWKRSCSLCRGVEGDLSSGAAFLAPDISLFLALILWFAVGVLRLEDFRRRFAGLVLDGGRSPQGAFAREAALWATLRGRAARWSRIRFRRWRRRFALR